MSGENLRKVENLPPNFENLGANELKNLCRRLHSSIKEYAGKRDTDTVELAEARNNLAEINKKLVRTEQVLKDKVSSETEFDTKYNALVIEKNKMTAAAEAKDEEVIKLTEKVNEYKRKLTSVLEERKEYENKILELSKLNAELKDKIHDLEDDFLKYQSENDDKNSSLSEKKGEIDELVSKQSEISKIYDLKYKLDAVCNDLER